MKTTVDLPDKLFGETRQFARDCGKTFKEVLIESLELFIGSTAGSQSRPGWESLFGQFKDDPETEVIRETIDREFSKVNLEDWT